MRGKRHISSSFSGALDHPSLAQLPNRIRGEAGVGTEHRVGVGAIPRRRAKVGGRVSTWWHLPKAGRSLVHLGLVHHWFDMSIIKNSG